MYPSSILLKEITAKKFRISNVCNVFTSATKDLLVDLIAYGNYKFLMHIEMLSLNTRAGIYSNDSIFYFIYSGSFTTF